MIHAIVFDAVGTLIHVQPDVASLYAQVGQRFGSRLDEDAIRQRFPTAFQRQEQLDRQAGWRTSEAREIERWRAIVAEVLDDVTDADACFSALFETFGESRAWSCASGAAELIAGLARCGVRQALASNFDRRLRSVIAPMPIACLDPVIISSQVGWRKPAPEFFAQVAETVALPMDQILYVGDDLGNDYEAARAVGMHAALLDPLRRHPGISTRIERLIDVWNLIH